MLVPQRAHAGKTMLRWRPHPRSSSKERFRQEELPEAAATGAEPAARKAISLCRPIIRAKPSSPESRTRGKELYMFTLPLFLFPASGSGSFVLLPRVRESGELGFSRG